ncbi:hypothetical protein GUJ93_ZPchr2153g22925 [Zizania palustris]|uniref:Uncharacterized protein n=1 Tax=Zizania palustris TaxID=103762 RepID=A0A8J5RAL6_ZIZPA|nr:hypothetical protein GUJ93_ZPchr2153g22925 [Zizania palustris]
MKSFAVEVLPVGPAHISRCSYAGGLALPLLSPKNSRVWSAVCNSPLDIFALGLLLPFLQCTSKESCMQPGCRLNPAGRPPVDPVSGK